MKNKDAEKFVKSLPTGEPESQSRVLEEIGKIKDADFPYVKPEDTFPKDGLDKALDLMKEHIESAPVSDDGLNTAFSIIKRYVDNGGFFSNAQLDIGIEMSLAVLPPPDQALFREVAEHNSIPLWQALWGQFRRCNEWGVAFTPILEPGWSATEGVKSLEPRACPICEKIFQPADWGQVFCTDKCGSEDERIKRDTRLAEEERGRLAALERMRRATPEPDVPGSEFSRPPEIAKEDPEITSSRLEDEEVPAEVLE